VFNSANFSQPGKVSQYFNILSQSGYDPQGGCWTVFRDPVEYIFKVSKCAG